MAHHAQLSPALSPTPSRNVHKFINKASKAIMKSHRISLPKYNLPIRLRPWFLVFTCIIMLILAFFGFADFSQSLPLNSKFLHLTCFCIATGVFYFIFDVEEDARRIWFWRHVNLILTAIVCFFFGGIVSEIVQSLLPVRPWTILSITSSDVVPANIIGSTIGLYTAYHIEKHYRSRREIARLYRPLNTDDPTDLDDYSDEEAGPSRTQLLPLFNSQTSSSAKSSVPSKAEVKANRLADVWDEREELFGIGDDSEPEDAPTTPKPSNYANEAPPAGPVNVPTITITRF
ncbi:hypothetical protein JVU11DRAFT_2675 [Chiua virens]|nr:hypothetical protein JVU11DRAFT_2675 [Chiua virens]